MATVERSVVPLGKPYGDYREHLRVDFWFSCAYCGMTEAEAQGIRFEIDHFLPQQKYRELVNQYDNLFWTCETCNGNKTDICPASDGFPNPNHFFLRPDNHDESAHYKIADDGVFLDDLTETGDFNIEVLDLNRTSLRTLRELRQKNDWADEQIAFGVRSVLKYSVDSLPAPFRERYRELVSNALNQVDTYKNSGQKLLIRGIAASPLLEADPGLRSRKKKRRDFLRRSKAHMPKTLE